MKAYARFKVAGTPLEAVAARERVFKARRMLNRAHRPVPCKPSEKRASALKTEALQAGREAAKLANEQEAVEAARQQAKQEKLAAERAEQQAVAAAAKAEREAAAEQLARLRAGRQRSDAALISKRKDLSPVRTSVGLSEKLRRSREEQREEREKVGALLHDAKVSLFLPFFLPFGLTPSFIYQ